MVRAEGSLVKSPSFFLKKVDFIQDYQDVGGFMLPTYLRTVAKARIIGLAVVHVFHKDYHPQTVAAALTANSGAQ